MKFKVGDIWRTYDNRLCKITKIDTTQTYPVFGKINDIEYNIHNIEFTENGHFIHGQPHSLDLIEKLDPNEYPEYYV